MKRQGIGPKLPAIGIMMTGIVNIIERLDLYNTFQILDPMSTHSQKRIMKPFAFAKPQDFRVFTKEHS